MLFIAKDFTIPATELSVSVVFDRLGEDFCSCGIHDCPHVDIEAVFIGEDEISCVMDTNYLKIIKLNIEKLIRDGEQFEEFSERGAKSQRLPSSSSGFFASHILGFMIHNWNNVSYMIRKTIYGKIYRAKNRAEIYSALTGGATFMWQLIYTIYLMACQPQHP